MYGMKFLAVLEAGERKPYYTIRMSIQTTTKRYYFQANVPAIRDTPVVAQRVHA